MAVLCLDKAAAGRFRQATIRRHGVDPLLVSQALTFRQTFAATDVDDVRDHRIEGRTR